jgi:hypothetical protein
MLPCFEGKLSHWPRLHLQLLAPTNPHWACVVGYGPFFLCVIHKEGLCPSSGGVNRLMMMRIEVLHSARLRFAHLGLSNTVSGPDRTCLQSRFPTVP